MGTGDRNGSHPPGVGSPTLSGSYRVWNQQRQTERLVVGYCGTGLAGNTLQQRESELCGPDPPLPHPTSWAEYLAPATYRRTH